MRYVANDGKVFDDECECSSYERELESFDVQRKADLKVVNDAKKKYDLARDNYFKAWNDYSSKYAGSDACFEDLMNPILKLILGE